MEERNKYESQQIIMKKKIAILSKDSGNKYEILSVVQGKILWISMNGHEKKNQFYIAVSGKKKKKQAEKTWIL